MGRASAAQRRSRRRLYLASSTPELPNSVDLVVDGGRPAIAVRERKPMVFK